MTHLDTLRAVAMAALHGDRSALEALGLSATEVRSALRHIAQAIEPNPAPSPMGVAR